MEKHKKFTIIGGDLRNVKLAESLAQDGHSVNLYGFRNAGFEKNIYEVDDLVTAIDESDVVIGPIPCSLDNETINTPFHPEKIVVSEVFKTMNKNQLFVAGRIGEKLSQLAAIYNVYTVDLLEREDMAILNAIPTAEGAIQIAMEETPTTLHNSNCLVLGFGRIGKILAKMLHGIGANVWVEARKYQDIALIESYGYKPVHLTELAKYVPSADIIFNTIPNVILTGEMLKLLKKECLIIDLASKPGGVDFEKAKEIGINTIWALSLPGKVAPVTAAKFIKNTVYNIIVELGV